MRDAFVVDQTTTCHEAVKHFNYVPRPTTMTLPRLALADSCPSRKRAPLASGDSMSYRELPLMLGRGTLRRTTAQENFLQ